MTKRFKIEPDLTCPELAGYKLPPCSRCQEDGVVKKLSDLFTSVGHNFEIAMPELKEGLIELCKAREKYEFTEDDMKYIFECGRNYQNNAEVTFKVSIDHLRTQRTPIAIEVEMKCGRCYMPLSEDDCWSAKECCQGSEGYPDIPATNPDGTVKGVYIYE